MSRPVPCPLCQEPIRYAAEECPSCGAPLGASFGAAFQPSSRAFQDHAGRVDGKDSGLVRRGLLAMLLGIAYYFFATGHSAWDFPFTVEPLVSESFTLAMSLSGLGLVSLDTLNTVAPSRSQQDV